MDVNVSSLPVLLIIFMLWYNITMNTNNNERDNNKPLKESIEDFRYAYRESLQMRRDFSKIDGYVRKKTPEEIAVHSAKKVFGREFSVGDPERMLNNTNNGKGASVRMPDGEILAFKNQLELFDEVVAMNKAYGGFYDRPNIERSSQDDYRRLNHNTYTTEETRNEIISFFSDKSEGWDVVKEIEKEVRENFEVLQEKISEQEKSSRESFTYKTKERDPIAENMKRFGKSARNSFSLIDLAKPRSHDSFSSFFDDGTDYIKGLKTIRNELNTSINNFNTNPNESSLHQIQSLSEQFVKTFKKAKSSGTANSNQLYNEGQKGAESLNAAKNTMTDTESAKRLAELSKQLMEALTKLVQRLTLRNKAGSPGLSM